VGCSGRDAAVGVETGADAILWFAAVKGGGEVLWAVFVPAHRMAQSVCEGGRHDFLATDDALLAETAADIGGDDAHLAFGQSQCLRDCGPYLMRDLCGNFDHELIVAFHPVR